MKILCILHDEEPNWLSPDPEELFPEHEVTCAGNYDEAVGMIRDPERGIPSFDIVLSDVMMPGNEKIDVAAYGPLLIRHTDDHLIRGLGLFVREDSKNAFTMTIDEFLVVVASTKCWSLSNGQNWEKLLNMVIARIERADARL